MARADETEKALERANAMQKDVTYQGPPALGERDALQRSLRKPRRKLSHGRRFRASLLRDPLLCSAMTKQGLAMTCRSFRSLRLRVARNCLSSSHHPVLQLVEIDIDDWRRIKGQNLRYGEAAHDSIAERLANLRSDPRPQHHRRGAKQCRHCGHQDRPKAEHAGLVYRLLGRQALAVFHLLSEIDQHDAVLLDDAN